MASLKFKISQRQYMAGNKISEAAHKEIQRIMNDLTVGNTSNKKEEWAGIILTKNNSAKVNTLIAIPYNPYEPKPYERWTLKGMLDLEYALKVAEEFWDFLGGKGAYNDLLDCFEKAGLELRPEIDEYFKKFR